MNSRDRTRLVNLLARTTSPHDGEALVAARKANELLRRLCLSWSDVIPSELAPQPEPAAAATDRASWHYEPPKRDERPSQWGADLFGKTAAYRPRPLPRLVVIAGKIRLFLSEIPSPIRIVLAPLSVSSVCDSLDHGGLGGS